MNIEEVYNNWVKNVNIPELQRELIKIKSNEEEKHDRFYKFLEFGTAGLRALMGAGTNRINIYTVRKVTQGFANYLLKKTINPSVAISYDSRNRSKSFAYSAAEVMAANGVKVYLSCELQPTPFLSFAVRKLGCTAGIMITASHNTSEYNGYKCYDKDGAQITEDTARDIYEEISKLDVFSDSKMMRIQDGLESGIVSFMGKSVTEEYLNCVTNQKINNTDFSNISVVYTPLNGCGMKMVCRSLSVIGVKNLMVVPEQKYPDGNFTTCKCPNPENLEAFSVAIKYAKERKADLIIATDPDADRLGICVRHKGEYKLLSGNQIGVLLFYYIIKKKKEFRDFSRKLVMIKTIVSSKMVNSIAKKEGCGVIEVLTGFKNIADQMGKLERKGNLSGYIFGFEESNGYLCGTYARDKDGVSAAVLICEVASYFKRNNLSLIDAISKLSEKYGYYSEKTLSFEFKGEKGKETINKIISGLKNSAPEKIGSLKVISCEEYETGSNVIVINLGGDNQVVIRPSGTEPKLKAYIMVHNDSEKLAYEKVLILSENVKKIINTLSEV